MKKTRTMLQEKAIAWLCTRYDYVPMLSAHPIYYFRTRDGREIFFGITTIVNMYKERNNAN